jgi:hypothetical protein
MSSSTPVNVRHGRMTGARQTPLLFTSHLPPLESCAFCGKYILITIDDVETITYYHPNGNYCQVVKE